MKPAHQKISKFLSYILRHDPASIGLTLDKQGWAQIDQLLRGAAKHGKRLSIAQLHEVVTTNDKQRFSISEDGLRIRANQGHSISVDLALEAVEPPATLYHGTTVNYLDAIFANGLKPQSRHHVHLSKDTDTALKVGRRHGKPAILVVDAQRMYHDGHIFFCSDNGVWLTDTVPANYLTIVSATDS